MENLEALNQVVSALGGTEEGKTNAEAIGKIAEKVPDAVLPATSGASEGDVLTVVSGKWAAQAPSGGGGGGTFEVTFSVDNDTWSADKTFAELKAAINGGQNILGLMVGESTTCLTLVGWYFAEGDTESVYFSIMSPMQGESSWTLVKRDFAFSSDESVSVEEISFQLTPSE